MTASLKISERRSQRYNQHQIISDVDYSITHAFPFMILFFAVVCGRMLPFADRTGDGMQFGDARETRIHSGVVQRFLKFFMKGRKHHYGKYWKKLY